MLQNSSGPFSRKPPKGTNPAKFSLPGREPIDDIIDPIVTSEDVINGKLDDLYTSPMSTFRNTSYDLDWRTYRDLADHSNFHVQNQTFGSGSEGEKKLFIHMELMYQGLLAGMSFLESHKYSLRLGPQPTK